MTKEPVFHIIPTGTNVSLCGVKAIYGKDGQKLCPKCNCQKCFDAAKKMIDKMAED